MVVSFDVNVFLFLGIAHGVNSVFLLNNLRKQGHGLSKHAHIILTSLLKFSFFKSQLSSLFIITGIPCQPHWWIPPLGYLLHHHLQGSWLQYHIFLDLNWWSLEFDFYSDCLCFCDCSADHLCQPLQFYKIYEMFSFR